MWAVIPTYLCVFLFFKKNQEIFKKMKPFAPKIQKLRQKNDFRKEKYYEKDNFNVYLFCNCFVLINVIIMWVCVTS